MIQQDVHINDAGLDEAVSMGLIYKAYINFINVVYDLDLRPLEITVLVELLKIYSSIQLPPVKTEMEYNIVLGKRFKTTLSMNSLRILSNRLRINFESVKVAYYTLKNREGKLGSIVVYSDLCASNILNPNYFSFLLPKCTHQSVAIRFIFPSVYSPDYQYSYADIVNGAPEDIPLELCLPNIATVKM